MAQNKKRRLRAHTVGEVRYFNYSIIFPDKVVWSRGTPFVGSLNDILPMTTFGKDPNLSRDLLNKGECHWKDHNGVEHLIRVENTECIDTWGLKKRLN